MRFDSAADAEPASAKINLALHILGRRPDRFHDIDSLAVFAEIGDRIDVEPTEGEFALNIDGPFARELATATPDNRNLVVAVTTKLTVLAGSHAKGTGLRLTKNIPIASGLGGGSADAAAAFRLLNRHWQLGLSESELQAMGVEFGADVPMCVASAPVRATGKGDRLTAIGGLPPLPIVLAYPSVGVSTAAVFGRVEGSSDSRLPRIPARFGSVADVAAWIDRTHNGLEQPAGEQLPAIGDALDLLRRSSDCLLARMTGSGSTCFGLFPTSDHAMRAAGVIRTQRPSWWVRPTITGESQ